MNTAFIKGFTKIAAKKEDTRSWYQKKRYLIPGVAALGAGAYMAGRHFAPKVSIADKVKKSYKSTPFNKENAIPLDKKDWRVL